MTRTVLAALLLIASGLAQAQPSAWQVLGANGGTVSLLGSVHYLREQDHPLPALIDSLYARADQLVMELDLDDLDPAQLQTGLLRAAVLPPNDRLPDVVDGGLYAQALARASEFEIDLGMLERFEPWLVAVTMLDVGMSRLGYRADQGIEQYLLSKAAIDRKAVLGLESATDQIAVFDGLSLRDQAALLEQTLAELDSAGDAMGEMVSAWRSGNLESLGTALLSDFDEFPGLYDKLVVNRNANWVMELERLLQTDQDYLVVVGALHLVGPDSLIRLLQDKGHTVRPLQ